MSSGCQLGGFIGFAVTGLFFYFVYGQTPHPASYGMMLGFVITGIAARFVGKIPNVDEKYKPVMYQILVLNLLFAMIGFFAYNQNSWGGINALGHNFSGVRGTYDFLPELSQSERQNFASIAVSNLKVSIVGALIASFFAYLLNLYLVQHYKIPCEKSFPRLLAGLVFLTLVSSSTYGAYQFFDKHQPFNSSIWTR